MRRRIKGRKKVVGLSMSPDELEALEAYRDSLGSVFSLSATARQIVHDALVVRGFLAKGRG